MWVRNWNTSVLLLSETPRLTKQVLMNNTEVGFRREQ